MKRVLALLLLFPSVAWAQSPPQPCRSGLPDSMASCAIAVVQEQRDEATNAAAMAKARALLAEDALRSAQQRAGADKDYWKRYVDGLAKKP